MSSHNPNYFVGVKESETVELGIMRLCSGALAHIRNYLFRNSVDFS